MSEIPSFFDAIELTARGLLINALRQTGGNKKAAARLLGMKRTTLMERIRSHGITSTEWQGEGIERLINQMWERSACGEWTLERIRTEQLRAQRYINSLEFFARALLGENEQNRTAKNIILEPDDEELDEGDDRNSDGIDLPTPNSQGG